MTASERYFLAGDSGGSKTDWIVFDRQGGVRATCRTSGLAALNPGMLDLAAAAREIREAVGDNISRIYLSLGGPNVQEVRELLACIFPDRVIEVEREANGNMILHAAGYLNCRAAIMIGTGSTAVGEVRGQRLYSGGWGPVYGDDGAGGGVGTQALRGYLRSLDGMADCGRIGELFGHLSVGLDIQTFAGRMELKSRANAMSRRELAALAPALYELAEAGDRTSLELFETAAREAAGLAAAVTSPDEPDGILGCGGFFRQGVKFRERCDYYLKASRPGHHWKWCLEFTPVKGSMLMILNRENIPVTQQLFTEIIEA